MPTVDEPKEVKDRTLHSGAERCTGKTTTGKGGKQDYVEVCTEFDRPSPEAEKHLADTDFSTQSMVPLPEWCTTDPSIGSWRFYRDSSCGIMNGSLALRVNGQETGRMTYLLYAYLYTDSKQTGWGYQIEISPISQSGSAAGLAIMAFGSASCGGEDCDVIESNFPPQRVSDVGPVDAQGESYYEMNPGTDDAYTASSIWQYRFQVPGFSTSTPAYLRPYTDVRCDDATGGQPAGCVLPDYIPTYTESLSGETPNYARHLRDAQQSGLPGAPDGEPLTRLVSPTQNDMNGDTACPQASSGGYPRPAGYSCDEYPFRSTAQGAYTANYPAPPSPGRTFDWCQISALPSASGPDGWSACMIPERENSVGGGRLGAFYGANRVIDGDDFHVRVDD